MNQLEPKPNLSRLYNSRSYTLKVGILGMIQSNNRTTLTINPTEYPPNLTMQTLNAVSNLKDVLFHQGLDISCINKITVFVSHFEDALPVADILSDAGLGMFIGSCHVIGFRSQLTLVALEVVAQPKRILSKF